MLATAQLWVPDSKSQLRQVPQVAWAPEQAATQVPLLLHCWPCGQVVGQEVPQLLVPLHLPEQLVGLGLQQLPLEQVCVELQQLEPHVTGPAVPGVPHASLQSPVAVLQPVDGHVL